MNKLCKILSMVVLMMVVIAMSISAYAYTNDDVIAYISKAHTVNGRTGQLSVSQRQSLTKYLQDNPVTDADANEIISKLDEAKNQIDNSGAASLSELDESIKAEVISLIKSAGQIAGLQIEIDTVNEVVTVKDSDGNVIISGASYSQYNTKSTSSTASTGTSTSTGTTASTGTTSTSTTSNNTTSSTGTKLVYTGNDYSSVIKAVIAIVAIAIIGVSVKRKYAK